MLTSVRMYLRDWFTMTVLASWTRHAAPEQLIVLGEDLVRRGTALQYGLDEEKVSVTRETTATREYYTPETLPDGTFTQLEEQKWVA